MTMANIRETDENTKIVNETKELLTVVQSLSESEQKELLAYLHGYKLGKGA